MNNSDHPTRGDETFHSACLGLHQFRRCVLGLGGLPCFILRRRWGSDAVEWWELVSDERRLRPFDFEFRFGVAGLRDAYHAGNLDRAARTGRARTAQLFGFWDFYAPLFLDESHGLFLYAGQFARDVPTTGHLRQHWKALSRREAVDTDPLFQRWVRACLEVVVLTTEQLRGLRKMGSILAKLASEGHVEHAQQHLQQLRTGLLAPFAVDHEWVRSALDPDGLTRPPWGLDPHLDPRLVEELGLTLRPSVIAVLSLRPSDLRRDAIEWQVVGRRLQRHALPLCRQFQSSLAAPLGQDRVVCALALESRVRGARRARCFVDIVRRLQQRLADEHGLRTVAGLGHEVVPGEGLGTSYQQASHALAAALERQLDRLRYDDDLAQPRRGRALLSRGERVVELVRAGRLDEAGSEGRQLAAMARRFERDPLLESRPHLLWTLDRICAHLVEDHSVSSVAVQRLVQGFEDESATASDGSALAHAFESHLARLVNLRQHERSVDREARLAHATRWLLRNLDVVHPLEEAARRAGLAPASFRRAFARTHGTSFATWVRAARIDLARNLLCHGDLSVAQIATRVGFGCTHTFIRQFRHHESMTPAAYRRRHLRDEAFLG